MQSEKYTQFSCPSCNEKSTFCAREIMNVTQNPQLRQDVLSGKFYRWICPKCGKEATIVYPTLYHDMTNKFIVYHAHKRDNDGPIVVGGKIGQKNTISLIAASLRLDTYYENALGKRTFGRKSLNSIPVWMIA